MSVKLIDNEAFYGFRVRRAINGKLYQEYFSLKAGSKGKRLPKRAIGGVKRQAEARDAELRSLQEKDRRQRKAERCFRPDGSVRGISGLVKREKSGTDTPIVQVGIASWLEGRIICTSFSVKAHGKKEAWRKAVAAYANHKQIAKQSKLYKRLLGAMDATLGRKSPMSWTSRKARVR